MRFKQVKDIIDWIIEFHNDLSKKYHQMSEKNQSVRVKLLLDYLSDHETQLKQALEKYKNESNVDSVLQTWFNQMPNPDYPKTLQELRACLCCVSVDETVTMAIQFHDLLIRMYEDLRNSSETQTVKDFFQSLYDMENHEKMRMVRDAARLGDI